MRQLFKRYIFGVVKLNHTLLFGNGLNLLSDNPLSWDALLNKLNSDNNSISKETPNTMKYEKILLDRSEHQSDKSVDEELLIKEKIAELMNEQEGNKYYTEIIEMGFDNYLTTNYDNAFCKSYDGKTKNESTEDLYSLRRFSVLESEKYKQTKLWHIHGEIEHPKSIMLGLDHYCGSISKIDGYLKGTYKFKSESVKFPLKKMAKKLEKLKFDQVSWVELFFNSNIHIIGLSLDYSETDLWWVLNKRARLMRHNKIQNKIFFYESNISESKKSFLSSMGVTVEEESRCGNESKDFLIAHQGLIEKLKNNTSS